MRRFQRFRRRGGRRRFPKKRVALLVILVALFCFFSFQLQPMLRSITITAAKQAVTISIEEAVKEQLAADSVDYADFINIERDAAGNILGITTNVVNMNRFKTALSSALQQKLITRSAAVGVPVGTLLGGSLLRGRGPSLPLKVGLIGNAQIDFQSSFASAGINQTIHKIDLTVTASCYSYLTGVKGESDVSTTVAVAETVIVGQVPETYANLQLPGLTAAQGEK